MNKNSSLFARCILLTATFLLVSPSLFAAGGIFTWSGAGGNNNWSTGGNWGGTAPGDPQNVLHFAGSTRTNAINDFGAYSGGDQIIFDSGASTFTLSGNPIKFFDFGGVNPKIENNSASVQTISMRIGAGNSFGLDINPASGDIVINPDGANEQVFLDGSSQLRINGNNSHVVTFNIGIQDGNAQGTFALTGNNIVIFAATNNFTGATFANAGILRLAVSGADNSSTINLGDTSGGVAATLQMDNGLTAASPLVIRNGSSGVKTISNNTNGSGSATFTGSLSLGDSLTLSVVTNGSLVLNGAIDYQNPVTGVGRTLMVGGAGNTIVNGYFTNAASGSSALIKTNAGTLTLNATNNPLRVLYNLGGGVLSITNGTTIGIPTNVSFPDKFNFTASATLKVTNSFTLGSYVTNGSATNVAGFRIAGGNAATFDVASNSTLTIDGIIADIPASGLGALVKAGGGNLILTQTNTYSSNTTVTAGSLVISNDLSLGAIPGVTTTNSITLNGGTLSIGKTLTLNTSRGITLNAGGGTIDAASGVTATYGGIVGGSGTLAKTGPGTLAFNVNNTFTNSVSVTGGTLKIANDLALGAVPAMVTPAAVTLDNGTLLLNSSSVSIAANRGITLNSGGGTLDCASGQSPAVLGNITGPGALSKISSGNLDLDGSNTFGGNFNIAGGGVRFNGNQVAGTGSIVITPNSIVTLRNISPPVTSSTVTNAITLNSNGGNDVDLTAASGNTFTLSGPISGGGYLTRGRASGSAGNIVLSGNSTNWSGGLFFYGGLLTLGHQNALGTGTLTIQPGNNNNVILQASTPLAGASAVPTPVSINITNRSFVIGGANALELSGPVALAASATITNSNSVLATLSGTISGTGFGLTLVGSGTTELKGSNVYSGGTTIGSGKLKVSNTSGSATGPGSVAVNSGTTLTGPGTISGAVTVDGTISPGSSPGTMTTGSETWDNGGHYTWEINSAAGSAGSDPGWDLLTINGSLNIAATSGGFTIDLTGLNLSDVAGSVNGFANTSTYTWTILHATNGITGFNASAFTLNTTAFSNNNPLGSGVFKIALANGGNDLVLNFGTVPSISASPTNRTVAYGDNVTFGVTAGGTTLAYQWRKGGTPLSGATDSSYNIPLVHTNDAGSYDVVVTNIVGSVTSAVATLTVNQAALTVTADDTNRVYGALNPSFTYSIAGFVNGETLATSDVTGTPLVTSAADTNSSVAGGPYAITPAAGSLFSTNYSFSFSNGSLTITPAAASLALLSSTNPSPAGSNVTFTATVTTAAPSLAVPGGSVQFLTNGVAAGSPVTLANGIATYSTTNLPHATNTVDAQFAGDGNIIDSTNTTSEIINSQPVAGLASYQRPGSASYKIKISDLLTNASDADLDSLSLIAVSLTSTNGAIISTNASYVNYLPPGLNPNVTDTFTYIVSDTFGATNSGTVLLTISTDNGASINITGISPLPDGNTRIGFAGIPNRTYLVQATTNLTPVIIWTTISTNVAGANGLFSHDDLEATNYPARYYRTTQP